MTIDQGIEFLTDMRDKLGSGEAKLYMPNGKESDEIGEIGYAMSIVVLNEVGNAHLVSDEDDERQVAGICLWPVSKRDNDSAPQAESDDSSIAYEG